MKTWRLHSNLQVQWFYLSSQLQATIWSVANCFSYHTCKNWLESCAISLCILSRSVFYLTLCILLRSVFSGTILVFIKNYSSWLAQFSSDIYDQKIEIPGQYEGMVRKPIPESHTTISGFNDEVRPPSDTSNLTCILLSTGSFIVSFGC